MGLDMYLQGRMFQRTDYENPENDEHREGRRVTEVVVELGYWRKHPDLHGYIVKTFAGGVDECQTIDLSEERLEQLIKAVEDDNLAWGTTGFFFGRSYQPGTALELSHAVPCAPNDEDMYDGYEKQKARDLKTLHSALEWLRVEGREREDGESPKWWRSVEYHASW